jgi:hypothetical protein
MLRIAQSILFSSHSQSLLRMFVEVFVCQSRSRLRRKMGVRWASSSEVSTRRGLQRIQEERGKELAFTVRRMKILKITHWNRSSSLLEIRESGRLDRWSSVRWYSIERKSVARKRARSSEEWEGIASENSSPSGLTRVLPSLTQRGCG